MPTMEEIYRAHSQTVYRYLISLTHDASLAEELTQETFYQAVKSIGHFDGNCKITTWLCAIAKNMLMSERRRSPAAEQLPEELPAGDSPENETLAKVGQVELIQRLHLLGAEMREVMYLRLLGDLSFGQIGEILGKTENWARVTYYRGKEKLKKELECDGAEAEL